MQAFSPIASNRWSVTVCPLHAVLFNCNTPPASEALALNQSARRNALSNVVMSRASATMLALLMHYRCAMRVLILSHAFPPHPEVGSLCAAKVSEAFAAAGHEVHVVTTRLGAELEAIRAPGDGITLRKVRALRHPRKAYQLAKRWLGRTYCCCSHSTSPPRSRTSCSTTSGLGNLSSRSRMRTASLRKCCTGSAGIIWSH